jgi:flagellar protein FliO/FliZ
MKSLSLMRGVAMTGALMLLHAPGLALAATGSASTSTNTATTSAGSGENTPLNLSGSGTHATHVSGGGGSTIVRTVVGLFIVIVVIYGIAWILRQAKKGRAGRACGKALRPIASMPLGSGRSLQLVRAGNDVLLVGVAEHGVTPIRRYTEAEAIEAGLELNDDDEFVPGSPSEERPLGRVVDALRRMTVRS